MKKKHKNIPAEAQTFKVNFFSFAIKTWNKLER